MILADEPTGALDSKSSKQLLDTLQDMNKELEATILMVTHDAVSASYAHRILFLEDGKNFRKLVRGNKSQKIFHTDIFEVMQQLGGEQK